MSSHRLSQHVQSFIEVHVLDELEFGPDSDEHMKLLFVEERLSPSGTAIKVSSPVEAKMMAAILNDFSNYADSMEYEHELPEIEKRHYHHAAKALATLASKMEKEARGLTPNDRRTGGKRAAEKRAEDLNNFLYDVEQYDPSLLPLARKLFWKMKKPKRGTFFESFIEMVESDWNNIQAEVVQAAEEQLEKDLEEYERLQQEQEPTIEDELEVHDSALRRAFDQYEMDEPDIWEEEQREPTPDWYEELDRRDDEEPEFLDEDAAEVGAYLEDVLRPKEYAMLRRVLEREGMDSPRELTCFFRAIKKRMKKNGLWRAR